MRFMLMEKDSVITTLAEPETDGIRAFFTQTVREGESFMGRVPYDLLKKFAPGMVDIDPDTFKVTAIQTTD